MKDVTPFYCPSEWVSNSIKVLLVGAGGNGSEMLDCLARLHAGLIGCGHPCGLEVTVMDGDTVSRANIGRQRFAYSDIGLNKAVVLSHRYNMFYQTNWTSLPHYLDFNTKSRHELDDFDLLITCVDKAKTRIEVAKYAPKYLMDTILWLDLGNGNSTGQFCLGHLGNKCSDIVWLPHIVDLFPELSNVDDNDKPSCSFEEAIAQQDLFVNRILANASANLLWQLIRHGKITSHGGFIDVAKHNTRPLLISPSVWSFFGYN